MLLVRTELRTSPIHGIGCFAKEDIKKGSIVWKFIKDFDQEFSEEFVMNLSEGSREQVLKYAYKDTRGIYVLCSDDARFFNHSKDNNISSVLTESGEYVDVANRDINSGEELTYDYQVFNGDPNYL